MDSSDTKCYKHSTVYAGNSESGSEIQRNWIQGSIDPEVPCKELEQGSDIVQPNTATVDYPK